MIALIISLNFNPGHVSHMVASYKQCEELGYKSIYYVDPAFFPFLPKGSNIQFVSEGISCKIDLAIFLFPSQKNLPLIWKLKHQGTKVIYIFHEPLAPMSVYRKAGFSYKYLLRLWLINRISALIVKYSDIILLPSRKSVNLYVRNHSYKNNNYYYLPLMYEDERTIEFINLKRQFFSYIGTIAADHSFNEYLDFVCWTIKNDELPEFNFLIATKSRFEIPELLRNSSRIVIKQGKAMTDEEINMCYASSIVVWNAYVRTTQSGVLAKSFMFGTPALVMRTNLNEFMHENANVVAIDENTDKSQIKRAIQKIYKNFENFSTESRIEFEKSFYYKVYNDDLVRIINKNGE